MAVLTVCSDLQTRNLMPRNGVANKVKSRRGRQSKHFFANLYLILIGLYCNFRNHKKTAHQTIFFHIFKAVPGLIFFERFLNKRSTSQEAKPSNRCPLDILGISYIQEMTLSQRELQSTFLCFWTEF